MDEYYEEEDYVHEQEFGQERNVFERVGIRNDLIDIDIDKKKSRTQKTPIERFVENVNAIALDLMNSLNIISEGDIKIILESIRLIENPEYKNPSAYILGYIATNGGNKIEKRSLKETFEIIEEGKIEDSSVTQPDVIRYCRLWLNLTK